MTKSIGFLVLTISLFSTNLMALEYKKNLSTAVALEDSSNCSRDKSNTILCSKTADILSFVRTDWKLGEGYNHVYEIALYSHEPASSSTTYSYQNVKDNEVGYTKSIIARIFFKNAVQLDGFAKLLNEGKISRILMSTDQDNAENVLVIRK